MKDFVQAVLIIAIVIMLLPAALILGVWAVVYGILLIPVAIAGILIWRAIQRHLDKREEPIPSYAVPIIPKPPKKQRMIKWQGKDIPLRVFIFSICLSIVLVPIFIICLLFIFPPFISACILGFMACRKVGELAQRKVQHG